VISVNVNYIAVRLEGSPSEGRVEILRGGVWGTVCDNGFTDREAKVVCDMLGFGYSFVSVAVLN